jgi:hypothetical protein
MSGAVNLSFRYSQQDYARAMRAHYASGLRWKIGIFLIVVVGAAGAYLWRSPDFHSSGAWFVAISAILALILIAAFVIIPIVLFRVEPKFRDGYSLTFSREGIHFRTIHIDSQLQWGMYSRALIDAHSYVLYYGSRRFTVIPKRVFQSAEQQREFEQMLIEHVPKMVRRVK